MNLRDYFDSLGQAEQGAYATRAGFSVSTLYTNFFPATSRRQVRTPTVRGLLRLADASEGRVTRQEALAYFADAIAGTQGRAA